MALVASICPRGWLLWPYQQACRWLLQPLGWRMLAADRGCPGYCGRIGKGGIGAEPLQQRRPDPVHIMLLSRSNSAWRAARQTRPVSSHGRLCQWSRLIRENSPSDAYHTCYVLSGLSSAEHKWELTVDAEEPALEAFTWTVSPYSEDQIFDEQDRIHPIDPVYTIPERCVRDIKRYFAEKQGF